LAAKQLNCARDAGHNFQSDCDFGAKSIGEAYGAGPLAETLSM
jgi:hypothetical protein